MELELRHGTFRVYIDGIASKFRGQSSHEPVYAATCSDYFRVTGTVPVVAGSGTGAYRGASGSFSLTLTGNEDQKGPPCGPTGFVSQILVLTGSGLFRPEDGVAVRAVSKTIPGCGTLAVRAALTLPEEKRAPPSFVHKRKNYYGCDDQKRDDTHPIASYL